MELYDFWRSSAAYRVRIVLNLKGLEAERTFINISPARLEHNEPAYREINPQGFVPLLVLDDGTKITQSMAICEYLDEMHPNPRLIPEVPLARADIRALAQMVACDIHPLNNARVLRFLKETLNHDQETIAKTWYAHWIREGFDAMEQVIDDGGYCRGETPSLADAFLIPQIYNAHRFEVDLAPYPRIRRVEKTCNGMEAFAAAAPEKQPDAVTT
ncbi:MAG: maleylacetoacetate isomerase [Hyphomicrobiales bacterium]